MATPLPSAEIIGPILGALDMLGIAVFAATGALAAARKGQTLVTFTFFALVTGVGGGTIRDLLIEAPVFWVVDSRVLLVILAVVAAIWFTPNHWWTGKALDWLDAVGLAAYSVFGTAKALQFGIAPLPAMMMGILTACAGGIIRDVLAGEPSILMRPEIYVTAAALSAGLFALLSGLSVVTPLVALVSALVGFALRGIAIHYRLGLPRYAGDKMGDQGE